MITSLIASLQYYKERNFKTKCSWCLNLKVIAFPDSVCLLFVRQCKDKYYTLWNYFLLSTFDNRCCWLILIICCSRVRFYCPFFYKNEYNGCRSTCHNGWKKRILFEFTLYSLSKTYISGTYFISPVVSNCNIDMVIIISQLLTEM